MSTFNTPIDWATCSAERQAEQLIAHKNAVTLRVAALKEQA